MLNRLSLSLSLSLSRSVCVWVFVVLVNPMGPNAHKRVVLVIPEILNLWGHFYLSTFGPKEQNSLLIIQNHVFA